MPYSNFRSGQIHFSVSGNGSIPVVFLHGFLGDMSVWERYLADLGPAYKILRIDLPGHGGSSTFDETHPMELMADSVITAMQDADFGSAHFVGHSMGGYVSMALTTKYPDAVCSITLFHSTALEDGEQKKKDRIRTIRLFEMSPELFVSEAINNLFAPHNLTKYPEEISRLKQIGLKTGLTGAAPALRGMALRPDMRNLLGKREIPTLFIAGKYDNIIPLDSVMDQAGELGAELLLLEHSGHMGFIEEYDRTLAGLVSFWNSLD